MMKPLLVLGATSYAAVFIDSFETIVGLQFDGCVENLDPTRCKDTLLGRPIYWFDAIDHLRDSHALICALATTHRKNWIEQMQKRGFGFASVVHPSAVVSKRSTLGHGVAVDAGAVIAGFTTVDAHVRIGRRASIGHHTMIGSYTTVHPGSIISGNSRIGRQVTVGTGAVIIEGISVGDGAVIAAGAVVTRSVAPCALVAGPTAVPKRGDYGPR
jgi:sugar O-acyltransferase (sialic acid O-acetyltransferase NeuD family)